MTDDVLIELDRLDAVRQRVDEAVKVASAQVRDGLEPRRVEDWLALRVLGVLNECGLVPAR